MAKKKSGIIVAGLALFSMFFGAGDLIWPLILGGEMGDKNFFAMLGLLITGVSLPLLGCLAILLFRGDYRNFFNQTGKVPGWILLFVIQAILGPLGSLPRLITLSFASLKPYMPELITLPIFSILASLLVFLFTIRRHRIIELLGSFLSPMLLLTLGGILVFGFIHPPAPMTVATPHGTAFFSGLNVGYNTLDLIASFIFAPLVMTYFCSQGDESAEGRRSSFNRMVKACLLAAGILATMYFGLTYVSSYYTPYLPVGHAPEERLAAISFHLLGSYGAFFSCIAVALSCLTTAIPISALSATFIHEDLLKKRGSLTLAAAISLGLSSLVANLGFMGIATLLSPVLQILCPGLILLSVLSILHKRYEMKMQKVPVLVTFALSTIGYLVR